jgi:hypothetical protein
MTPLPYTVNTAGALGGVSQCFSIVGWDCARRHRNGDQGSDDGAPRQSASASGGPGSCPAACGTSADCSTPGDLQFGCHRKSRAIICKQEYQGPVRVPDRLTSREAMLRFPGLPQSGIHKFDDRFQRQDGSYCWLNDQRHLIRGEYGKSLEVVRS